MSVPIKLKAETSRITYDGEIIRISADPIIVRSGKFDAIKRRINRFRSIAVGAVTRVHTRHSE